MKMNGARIMLECLKKEGVTTIFGYPGGTVINIYDELFSFKEIRHILPATSRPAPTRLTAMPVPPARSA